MLDTTGMAAVADDTGLEVDDTWAARPASTRHALPGPTPAYAENVAKLLDELERAGATAPDRRRARFRCVAFVAFPDGDEIWMDGDVDGTIAPSPAGASGFGYDPVFVPDGLDGRTFAELSPRGEARGLPSGARIPRAGRTPHRPVAVLADPEPGATPCVRLRRRPSSAAGSPIGAHGSPAIGGGMTVTSARLPTRSSLATATGSVPGGGGTVTELAGPTEGAGIPAPGPG